MLVLAAVFAPALAGSEDKPLAHVGHLGGPAAVGLGRAFTATQALDDAFDLQKLGF